MILENTACSFFQALIKWENFFTWWLMWTYNPASTRRRSMFNLQGAEFWMSRKAFIEKYGRDSGT
jgi:hypothetical protein